MEREIDVITISNGKWTRKPENRVLSLDTERWIRLRLAWEADQEALDRRMVSTCTWVMAAAFSVTAVCAFLMSWWIV